MNIRLIFLLSAVIAPACAVAAPVSPDMQRFRANLIDFYCGNGADPKDPAIPQALARLERTARSYLESMVADGADPGVVEPPTQEEIESRKSESQVKSVKKDAGPQPGTGNAGKPAGGAKGGGKKSRGEENGSWRDLCTKVQEASNSSSWSIALRAHYDRVLLLAQAYHTPGQSLHNDPAVKHAIERGLTFAAKYVYASIGRTGMTDPREIRVPMRLGPILILMQGDLGPDIFIRQVQLLGTVMAGFEKMAKTGTGANLVWGMMNHQYHAILTNDGEKMSRAARLIGSSCTVGTQDGIQPDNSYLFHDRIVTIGSYGTGQVHELARYSLFARGTSYGLLPEQLNTVVNFAVDGVIWNTYHNYAGASVVGRAITRGQPQTGGFHAMLFLANTPNPRQHEFVSAARKVLETWQDDEETYRGQTSAVNGATAFEMAALVSAVKRSPVAAAWPSGHRHYPYADYTVHRGLNYFLSVKMLSKRIRCGERAWGDGMKTWHLSDGFTYLVLRGDEYFEHDVLPTLDWNRLPGTTVERSIRDPQFGFGLGTRAFVGGASMGRCGVSAMDFAAIDSPLTARKSWFFFEDQVVCLGSDITCPTADPVETTVNQWPLAREETPLYVNGEIKPAKAGWHELMKDVKWAACDGIGYYFPDGQTLHAQREVQSGTWEEIGSRPGHGMCRNPFLTLWYDHGANAAGQKYAYALLPNKTPEAMQQYAASKPFTILAQSGVAHAVKHHGLNAVGVAFWQAGAVDQISVDRPCIVFYQISGTTLTVAVSDPTQGDATVRVPGPDEGKPESKAPPPLKAAPAFETSLHLTFDARLTPIELPADMTLQSLGNRTEITVTASHGLNYVAKLGRL